MSIDQKYVVLDVETTGLKSHEDDLISISIYKPDTEEMYNRFLPLELCDSIPKEAAAVNGITKQMLKGKKSLTQDEVDWLIEAFELNKRTILTYGTLDERFIRSYFKRHALYGYEEMSFFNFKNAIISSRFSKGTITKDNLCNLYGIKNVTSVHSSENDCRLEWALFKEINGKDLFIDSENKVFEMTKDYIIPAGYLYTHPKLKKYIAINKNISVSLTEIGRFPIAEKERHLLSKVINFYGTTIENIITILLNAQVVDPYPQLRENKMNLHYIGRLPSPDAIIPLYVNEDGTVTVARLQDKALEKRMNSFIKDFKPKIESVVEFIRKDIFRENPILSHELVVNRNANVLAVCDLSSTDTVLELKTTQSLNADNYRYQLYFESAGRDCYIMQTDWAGYPNFEFVFSKVTFSEKAEGERDGKHALDYRWKNFQHKIPNKKIIVTNYVNQASDVELKCAVCENTWVSSPYKVLNHPICPYCYPSTVTDKSVSDDKAVIKLTEVDRRKQRQLRYASKVFELSYGEVRLNEYTGSKSLASFECTQCGHIWEIRADKFMERPWCPICIKSKKQRK